MKKFCSIAMLLAAAAMAFTSCTKEEPKGPENTTVLNITATSNATKSYFGAKDAGAYPVVWTTAKQVCFSANDTKTPVNVTPALVSEGASISCSAEFAGLAENGTIWAFSPVGNFSSSPKVPGFTSFTTLDTEDAIYLNIPAEQTPLAGSVDECCQAMVASQTYTNGCTDISMTFDHIVAYGKMTITNFAGTIKSVELQFPVSINGGSCKYAYKTGELAGMNGNSITLDPANVVGNTFWFALAPTAGNTGTMKIIVTDDSDYTYTKTIDLTAKALPFVAGQVSKFSANFNGIEKDENCVTLPWDWEGGVKNDFTAITGVTASGLGDDYAAGNAPYRIKFDSTGDYIVIKTDSEIGAISIGVKMIGGSKASSLTVSGSPDGISYTEVQTLSISGAQNSIHNLTTTNSFNSSDRYIKIYFNKGSNVGIGPISITSGATPTCATPVISYSNPTVTITCAEDGAAIHYTLDGTDPTGSSTTYTAPFDLNASTTVKAIAVKVGYYDSEIASLACVYVTPATISCSGTLNVANSESDGTINVTYTGASSYDVKVYEDAEHNNEAGNSFWFSADFEDAGQSDYDIYWIAEANTGSARNAYIVITALNSASDETTKEIVVTQAAASGENAPKTITLTANQFQSSYGDNNFSLDDMDFTYTGMMYNGKNALLSALQKQFIQMRKSGSGAGTIYNTNSLGQITNITVYVVNNANLAYTVYCGSTSAAETNSIASSSVTPTDQTVDYTNSGSNPANTTAKVYSFDLTSYNADYFKLVNGSSAGYLAKIEITFIPK